MPKPLRRETHRYSNFVSARGFSDVTHTRHLQFQSYIYSLNPNILRYISLSHPPFVSQTTFIKPPTHHLAIPSPITPTPQTSPHPPIPSAQDPKCHPQPKHLHPTPSLPPLKTNIPRPLLSSLPSHLIFQIRQTEQPRSKRPYQPSTPPPHMPIAPVLGTALPSVSAGRKRSFGTNAAT